MSALDIIRIIFYTDSPRLKGGNMIIETERLILREYEDSDFDALYAVLGDTDIMQHYPYTFDGERVRKWIARNKERYVNDGFGLMAVVLKETGEVIGDCGLTMQMINGVPCPEIGYHIRRDVQRKGYAREAAAAVRDWAFTERDFDTLYSYMKYTNVPSYSTAMSIGMHYKEEYPDPANTITKVYCISREEWKRLRVSEQIGSVKK